MKKYFGFFLMLFAISIFAAEQRGGGQDHQGGGQSHGGGGQSRGEGQFHGGGPGRPEVGGGHIPQHGPDRATHTPPHGATAEDHPRFNDRAEHPEAPHVHANNDQWVGHS